MNNAVSTRAENIKDKESILAVGISSLSLHHTINPFPNDKFFLDWSNLKAFADNKIKVTQKLIFGLGRVENIVGKGKNAGYQHFLFFPHCF